MQKNKSNQLLEDLLQRLRAKGGSVSLTEILREKETRSTLVRYLSKLEQNGEIKIEGKGKSTVYVLRESNSTNLQNSKNIFTESIFSGKNEIENFVWQRTKEFEELKEILLQPLEKRVPVGYDPEFLQSYTPNKTKYLSESIVSKLKALGTAISPTENAPAGTYAKQVLSKVLVDLSWNSSRLEGNTYSLLETQKLLELGKFADGKNAQETQMILNHKAAIEFIVDSVGEFGITSSIVCNTQAILSDNLLDAPEMSGALRKEAVAISGSVYLPVANQWKLKEYFDLFISKLVAIANPFEQAFFALVHLPYLQPFVDVNKRTSRLVANIPLMKANLYPLSFTDVSKEDYIIATLAVYEFQRVDALAALFEWAYERSAQIYKALRTQIGQPNPFRVKHREVLIEAVGLIVRQELNFENLSDWVKNRIDETENLLFCELVSLELKALHGGNFARFRIRPSEWIKWEELQGKKLNNH